jgi:hypothetical protein
MLARGCAVWLAVLVLLPFTPPFSTVDLADLIGQPDGAAQSHDDGANSPSSPRPAPAIARAGIVHALPLPMRGGRNRAGLSRLRLFSFVTFVPRLERASAGTSADGAAGPPAAPTVLRI